MSDLVMLAHEYKEDKHKSKVEGWYITEKYDGVCGLFRQKDKTMYSRNGNSYTLPDFIVDQLVDVGLDLHGEIWFGHDTFDLCSGMARRDDNDDEAWKSMIFMVFDTPDKDLLLEDRLKKLGNALKAARARREDKLANIKGVKFRRFNSKKTTIDDELRKVEQAGGEGLVLRKPASKYVVKRSHDMLKVKSWTFKEAVVTGYNVGTGKYKGMVGSLKVNNEEFGDFKVGSGLNDWQRGGELESPMDDAERQVVRKSQPDHSKSDHYKQLVADTKETGKTRRDALRELNAVFTVMPVIGDTVTFRYKETTKDGNPKFPTFVGVRDYE